MRVEAAWKLPRASPQRSRPDAWAGAPSSCAPSCLQAHLKQLMRLIEQTWGLGRYQGRDQVLVAECMAVVLCRSYPQQMQQKGSRSPAADHFYG